MSHAHTLTVRTCGPITRCNFGVAHTAFLQEVWYAFWCNIQCAYAGLMGLLVTWR